MLSLIYDPSLTSAPDYWKNGSFYYTDLCGQINGFIAQSEELNKKEDYVAVLCLVLWSIIILAFMFTKISNHSIRCKYQLKLHSSFGEKCVDCELQKQHNVIKFCSVQFSSLAQLCPTVCDPMNRSTPGLPLCPSTSPGVHANSRSSSQWCHPAISSSVVPSSTCP